MISFFSPCWRSDAVKFDPRHPSIHSFIQSAQSARRSLLSASEMCEGLGRQGSSYDRVRELITHHASVLWPAVSSPDASDPLREGNQLVDHCFPPLFHSLPPPHPLLTDTFLLFSNISAVSAPHPLFDFFPLLSTSWVTFPRKLGSFVTLVFYFFGRGLTGLLGTESTKAGVGRGGAVLNVEGWEVVEVVEVGTS